MKNKGLFRPLVLGTILALGFLAVWMFIGVILLEDGDLFDRMKGEVETLAFREDGTALIAHREEGGTSYRDLQGTPVTIPEDEPFGAMNVVLLPDVLPVRSGDSEWEYRVRSFTVGRTPHTAWYFIADGRPDGRAYFVAYDIYSKAKIGYLGTCGFRPEMPPPEERFPFVGATNGSRLKVVCPGQDSRTRRVPSLRSGFASGQSRLCDALSHVPIRMRWQDL